MTDPASPPRSRSWTTLWYYVVAVGSLGILSGVPFAHAATRLRGRPGGVACAISAVAYTAAIVVGIVLSASRTDPADATGGMIAIIVMVAAVVHLTFVRRQVARVPAPAPVAPTSGRGVDPAVAAVLAGRQARERARGIVASDPAMARELRIGRPDLPRTYDDGGLVDLNSAPAGVIAQACGVEHAVAQQLVAARAAAGSPFQRVDDVFAWTDIPVGEWDRIRDRAVCVV